MEIASFLSKCSRSSQLAVSEFSSLLSCLEDSERIVETRTFLSKLINFSLGKTPTDMMETYHFSFFTIDISSEPSKEELLTLLQLPSTFAPEDWSYTFYEGISRYAFEEFSDKKLVELGCGNGWISIAVAKKYLPREMYGLDINPRAILSSKLNLYINSYNEKGEVIIEGDGRSLYERLRFAESDLLNYFIENDIDGFDAILGCIPQVLIDSNESIKERLSDADDDFLYSLSNYTEAQGFIEDQFGLGLIARTIEEGLALIKPKGKFILNLGGRPGQQVLHHMFKRRGFSVNKIWERKVHQAKDTEIDSLIALEKEKGHRFEFFTSADSELSVNAQTADIYLQNNGNIVHKLTVFEFIAEHHQSNLQIFKTLNKPEFKSVKALLDLDYVKKEKKEEKLNFLSKLCQYVDEASFFPYYGTSGLSRYRNNLVGFINSYYQTSFLSDSILVAPNKRSLIQNILHIYPAKNTFVCEEEFQFLKHSHPSVVEVPACSFELNRLIEKVEPEIVIAKVNRSQGLPIERLAQLLEIGQKANSRIFIDISEIFELSSSPAANEVLAYFAFHELPENIAIICELSQNEVYKTLASCFILSSNQTLLNNLRDAAELSYSRPPLLTQLYYSCLIEELLQFQMTKIRSKEYSVKLKIESEASRNFLIQPSNHANEAFVHPAIKGNHFPITEATLRLDYGENELPTSTALKVGILESFAIQHLTPELADPSNEVRHFTATRFGFSSRENIIYGNGVAPLFTALLMQCKAEDGTLCIPTGVYGYFAATATFLGVKTLIIPTDEANDFKLSDLSLNKSLKEVTNPWIFLNYPLVNPTGAQYSEAEISKMFEGLSGLTIIADTVFSGLEFDGVIKSKILGQLTKLHTIHILGGISKEYAAGGIRFGFLYSSRNADLIAPYICEQPHYTVLYAAKLVYAKYFEQDAGILNNLTHQQQQLKKSAEQLSAVLTAKGWSVITAKGGLFMVASPRSLMGKTVYQGDKKLVLDADNIANYLFTEHNLLINNASWTGIDGYCRIVLSVRPELFEKAMKVFDRVMVEE